MSRGIITIPMPSCDGPCPSFHSIRIGKDARREIGGFFVVAIGIVTMNLDFEKSDGLVTAVIQYHVTGRVLMVGHMNKEAFRKTVETGFATFWSRSRRKLWLKGESSGHRLAVKEIFTDCDRDTVLLKVEALGPGVCHKGYQSCFFRRLEGGHWTESEPPTYDPHATYGDKR